MKIHNIMHLKKPTPWHWWLTSVIVATQEAQIRRTEV
jgi:hypothetical protein